ncbi:Mobile element protein [Pseudomonas chlororaphis subsp. aureofaciens]|nr:Mobile element protein [Pseudomonas chlororaphis subsp. aureofaciens]
MWADVLARFEKKAPASVMAKLALEQAIAPEWVDQVFEEHRQRQYSRELLFSTIVKLMSLVSLGLKPSLHAAAKQLEDLPVSLAALYDKVSRTEPALLRALVTGCAQRLTPTIKELGAQPCCPIGRFGW